MYNLLDPFNLAANDVVNIPFGYTSPEPTTPEPCNTQENIKVCLQTVPTEIVNYFSQFDKKLPNYPLRDWSKTVISWEEKGGKTVWEDVPSGFYFEWDCINWSDHDYESYSKAHQKLKSALDVYCKSFTGTKQGESTEVRDKARRITGSGPCDWPLPYADDIDVCIAFWKIPQFELVATCDVPSSTLDGPISSPTAPSRGPDGAGSFKTWFGTPSDPNCNGDVDENDIFGPAETQLMWYAADAILLPDFDFKTHVFDPAMNRINKQFNQAVNGQIKGNQVLPMLIYDDCAAVADDGGGKIRFKKPKNPKNPVA